MKKDSVSKFGLAPGSLVFTGTRKMIERKISVTNYKDDHAKVHQLQTLEETLEKIEDTGVTWINVDGLHDVDFIKELCGHFKIHQLTIEDIISVNQRPKIEEQDNYTYVVAKMLNLADSGRHIDTEQVSFILCGNVLLTFQEKEGDVFHWVSD